MASKEIGELQRVFTTRLQTLAHVLDVGETHFSGLDGVLHECLAPDMYPLGTQVAFACNQPRGFAQWCAGDPVENLPRDVGSVELARSYISQTVALVAGIAVDDGKLDQTKRIGLGPGMYCELSGRQYVSEFLLPNFYFHITTTYAILRKLGAPLGKADFMTFLAPHVKQQA